MSLFKLDSEKTMGFLSDESKNTDGIYRPSLDKALNKRDGYKATIRFLPNVTDETGDTGEAALTRLMTYVKMSDPKHKSLSGYYDSPKNFDDQCELTNLYFTLKNSGNPILEERAKSCNKVTRFYSYVYIVEDENQPDLEGKIMIYQYGWKIKEKIKGEWRAENPERAKCDIFDLANGKDFELKVIENAGFPNYDASIFLQRKAIAINGKVMPTSEAGGITMIDESVQGKILKFILAKEVNLEDFAPKPLTDVEKGKISKIVAILTGDENAAMFENNESNEDISADDLFSNEEGSALTDDDFADTATETVDKAKTTEESDDPFGDIENVEVSDEEDPFAGLD
jgi:hypothetical protein